MADPTDDQVTLLLHRLGAGEPGAADELLPLLLVRLRDMAQRQLSDQPNGHTLQPTALVNEAWLKLSRQSGDLWQSRRSFFAVAARAMRSVLVDHARARAAAKRNAGSRVAYSDTMVQFEASPVDVAVLDEALTELAGVDAELAEIVDLLFFGGLDSEEAAAVMGCSARTIQRGWRTARAWLATRLGAT